MDIIKFVTQIAGKKAWTPNMVSGLNLWLDASDLSGSDGDVVSSWVSKEGNNYNFAQADEAKQPLLKKAANGIGGHNIVRFDGSNDLLVLPSAPFIGVSGTAFIVYRLSATPSTHQHLFSSCDEATTSHQARLEGYYGPYMASQFKTTGIDNAISGNSLVFPEVPYIGMWQSNDTVYAFALNGVAQEITATAGEDAGTWFGDIGNRDNTVIGGLKRTTEAAFLKGDVAEILLYDSALDVDDTALVEAYIRNKYALNSGTYSIVLFGGVGDGTTDCTNAFNNAIDAVSNLGGGTIYIPTGTYKIASNITWKSNVNLTGDGIGSSIIALYGTASIIRAGSIGNELSNCTFSDVEIDGTNQTTPGTTRKGFFFTYCQQIHYLRVSVHDTGATGFGNDFLVNCTFTDCVATGCGRLGAVENSGCSGFGIGTGKYLIENTILTNCTATGNKRYGVFFEIQGADDYKSSGIQIIGGTFNENQWGVGDCGVDGLIVIGSEINSNLDHGVIVNGPSVHNIAGINGTIENCEIAFNTNIGISPVAPDTYTLTNNNVHDNGALT